MRKPFSYANVTATLALVFAMTGGALAANHYLVESTKQIKPSVLKKLKGNKGAKGATGAQGAQGAQGGQGGAGPQGPAGTAVAFAHLQGDSVPGTPLDTANSKNVSAASVGEPGLYCITTSVPITNATGNTDLATISEGPDTVAFNFTEVPLAVVLKLCPASTTVLAETITSTDKPVTLDAFVSFN